MKNTTQFTRLVRTIPEFREFRATLAQEGKSLGLVPTMGGLHAGHLSLLERSLSENDCTAITIFLNRTQFNNPKDLEKYPAVFEEDLAAVEEMGVDVVFAPEFDDIYPDDYRYKVVETDLSSKMEGTQRPGHFDGVLTVVMKLLNIAQATRAYFGEKDYQQLQLVAGMAKAFFIPTQIVPCPIVRDENGLALSSRNRRLSEDARNHAAAFPKILQEADTPELAEQALREAGFEVEYVVEENARRFGAVQIEGIRLIDNFEMDLVSK